MAGYATTLIFLEAPNPDFAVDRVATRAAMGGHSIPEADMRRRYERAIALFHSVYRPLVDVWFWYQWNGQAYEIREHSAKAP